METYIFSNADYLRQAGLEHNTIQQTLERVARNTDTRDLVTALYLLRGHHQTRGSAFVRSWMTPETFLANRGKWTFTQKWGIPADLPSQFKLIRMRLDVHLSAFPLKEMDVYGWELQYHHFNDRLAALFAHELHHFRRHHLGLHTREGEHAANRWALEHVQNLGYNVICTRRVKKKKHRSLRSSIIKRNPFLDPYASFRKLVPGDRLIIVHDPRKKYINDLVTVMRGIRINSKRIVIQTSDRQIWRWPMNWLKIPGEGRS
jgi:hypothetical protein